MSHRTRVARAAGLVLSILLIGTGCGSGGGGGVPDDDDAGVVDAAPPDRPDARQRPDAGPGCVPATCEALGKNCGPVADGCGGLVECGTCEAPETCGGSGTHSVCGGVMACVPKTCAELGVDCGWVADGCGQVVQCGTSCPTAGDTCGGGGEPNQCGQPAPDPEGCPAALTCAEQNATCGTIGNGCGGTLSCGGCPTGTTCGGGGTPNQCGRPTCEPLTCANYPADSCGPVSDGCGGVLTGCGETCQLPETCGGGGVAGRCGSSPTTCVPIPPSTACAGGVCGPVSNGCGGTVQCGGCPSGTTCGGGGNPGHCGAPPCDPRTCDEVGAGCGAVPNGCGGMLDCGGCPSGDSCGGGGEPNQCGHATCTPRTCAEQGITCGAAGDGCGGVIQCGGCTGGQTCGGGGVPGTCGAPACDPQTCEDVGATCGPIGDGCGGVVDSCGTCGGRDICGGGGVPSQCGGGSGGGGEDCTGLCEDQVACPNGGATTLTGTVFAPNGTLPLPNAVVYVPNAPLPAIPTGASCDRCEDEELGSPLVSTLSATDGTFTLRHVPANVPFPLVVKVGKWRRVVTITPRTECGTTALTAEETRLPRTQAEGNIPFLAISTGSADAMECVMRKIGVADSEFTRPSGTGRIRLYRYNGAWPSQAAYECSRCGTGTGTTARTCRTTWCGGPDNSNRTNFMNEVDVARLHETQAALDGHDMTVFACEGGENDRDASDARFRSYVDRGGRSFLSHYSYHWIEDNDPLSTTASWNLGAGQLDSSVATVDTSFPKGQTFSQWLDIVGASHQQSGQLLISDPRYEATAVRGDGRRWVYTTAQQSASAIQQLTFNTPIAAAEDQLCGRVVYSAFHATPTGNGSGSSWFPDHCSDNGLTPQEKVLAFMLFDVAACISDDNSEPPPPPTCTALTCGTADAECGIHADGCGNYLDCGLCPTGEACVQNECISGCVPRTCAQAGAECGVIGDGCGGSITCGDCMFPEACGGGGVPNQCGQDICDPRSCADVNAECGSVPTGCDDTVLDCGDCPSGSTCGGDGVPYQCGDGECTPLTCADVDAECGLIGDGCGGTIECGPCTLPETCGGGGEPNQCGGDPCPRLTCADVGAECGPIGDGCGGSVDCGVCPDPLICGGDGIPSQCGGACEPITCADLGAECGLAGDGCGGAMDCGVCVPGETCGGTGTPYECGPGSCAPMTCADQGAQCGPVGDGCGGLLECGVCPDPQLCGGGGVPNQCGGGCTPTTCADVGAECGVVADGCGGLAECGECEAPSICGGNGVPNQCGQIAD
jgi:hypothetical protein